MLQFVHQILFFLAFSIHFVNFHVNNWTQCKHVGWAVGPWQQEGWTRRENTVQCKVTWSSILQADFPCVCFRLQAVYNALQSPANLHAWGKKNTPSCLSRYRRGFLEYLFSNCTKALADGHYRCHHYQVLKAVAESIATSINTSKYHFTDSNRRPPQSLWLADGWPGKTNWAYPAHCINIYLDRNDHHLAVFITSDYAGTVPWEERIEEAYKRKCGKYQELVEEYKGRGWRTFYEPIEVGCRGFAGRSLWKVLGRLGVTWQPRRESLSPQAKLQRKPWDGCGWKGQICGLPLGHKPGLDHPSWLTPDPKCPVIPGIITDHASQFIHEIFLLNSYYISTHQMIWK